MKTTHGGYFRFLFDPGVRYSLFPIFMHTQQIFTKKNKK